MSADDAAGDPTGDCTEPPADNKAEEPVQVTLLVGARAPALEQHTPEAPNDRAAGEAK